MASVRYAPAAPSLERGSLVWWMGDHQGGQLERLDRRVVGAVATSLVNAPRNRAALDRALNTLGLGLGYEIEAWRNQLRADDHLRGSAWKATGLAIDGVYRPDEVRLTDAGARRRARLIIAAQVTPRSGVPAATIVLTGGHFLEHDPLGVGHDNELRIAYACAREFTQRGLGEASFDGSRRRLFASVLVNGERLDGFTVREVVRAYAELPVDGFFVSAANFNESLKQARLVRELALGLQSASAKPVVARGLWHWHIAALERGLAATCVGPYGLKLRLWPDEPEPVAEGEDPPGRATFVYHGAILGCLPVAETAALKRAAVFARHPCRCGAHPPAEPPKTHEAKIKHNAWWLMRESAGALAIEAGPSLAQRVPAARKEREAVHVGRLAACWSAVADEELGAKSQRHD